MTTLQTQLKLVKLNIPLILLTLLRSQGLHAQTVTEGDGEIVPYKNRETTSTTTPGDNHEDDVDCEWNDSLG